MGEFTDKKTLYFIEGATPTAAEALEIAKIEGKVFVRSARQDGQYANTLEVADYVAGTSVPTLYAQTYPFYAPRVLAKGRWGSTNTPLPMSLEGDSITNQSFTSTNVLNAIGWPVALNALSRNLFPIKSTQNFAASGGTLAQMDADIASQVGTMTGSILGICGGANDIAVTTPSLATFTTAFDDFKANVLTTQGKPMLWLAMLPRTQDAGVPLTAVQMRVLKQANQYFMANEDVEAGAIVVNAFEALCLPGTDQPDPRFFKNESGKLLHPNSDGALVIAKVAWRKLQNLGFTQRAVPPSAQNILTNKTLTGTGGTASTNASGTVADNCTLSGSGGTNSRVGSKPAGGGQGIAFAPASGSGASANVRLAHADILKSGGAYANGDVVYGWARIRVDAALRADGPYLQLTEVGSPSTIYLGYNKGGATTGFLNAVGDELFMVTPEFTIPSTNTALRMEAVSQCETAANAGITNFTVLEWGINKVV